MYHLDPNINAAVERQADRVRAVRDFYSRRAFVQPDRWQATPRTGRTNRVARKATPALALALAAAGPLLLVAWGLMQR